VTKIRVIAWSALLVLLGSFALLCIMIGLTVASPKFARDIYDHAFVAYEMGDYERAQRLYEEACAAGSKDACDVLGPEREPSYLPH
jgi:hypothetical protein